jgi:probable HAF family extracellular repeat protein
MKRVISDMTRVGVVTAVATAAVLAPARLLPKATPATPTPQAELLHVESVGPLELTGSMGVAINDKNEIVGTAFGDDEVRAFVVRNRRGELLPLPKGAPFSAATGINAKGDVVGVIGNEENVRGTVWAGNKPGVLTSGKRDTMATTISGASVAAGVAFDNQGRATFTLNRPQFLDVSSGSFDRASFGLLRSAYSLDNGFSGMLWSKPGDGKAIGEFVPQSGNASGTLVGLTIGKSGPVPAAFKNGKMGTLPVMGGLQMAIPMAANERDIFVGAGISEERMVKPIGWSKGKTGELPVPGSKQGLALGINDNNQVVGVIETEGGEAHAAVWSGGKVIDLNDVIDGREGWTLVQARGINNKGFVVGTGVKDGKVGAFVVGPVK